MTFLELYTELSDRGFSHLTTARLKAYINRARARLDGMQTWTYREKSVTGVAPLSVPDVGIVEAVSNETQSYPLEEVGYGDLVDWGLDLSLAGSPTYWYRASPLGAPTVATYPTGTDTIGVQYWKVTVDLSADADVPVSPSRYHLLIVDIAQQQAERERGNYEASQALQPDIDRQVQEMVNDLLPQQQPAHQKISFNNSEDW